jgi:hypothetical protein
MARRTTPARGRKETKEREKGDRRGMGQREAAEVGWRKADGDDGMRRMFFCAD